MTNFPRICLFTFLLKAFLFFGSISPLSAQDAKEGFSVKGDRDVRVVWHYSKPFFFRDSKGELQGIEYEMMSNFFRSVEQEFGIRLNITWDEAEEFSAMYNDVRDASPEENIFGVASISITDERAQEVNFTPSYFPDIEVIVSSENVPIAETLNEFKEITKQLRGVTVPNTTFDKNFEKLKADYLGDIELEPAKDSKLLIDRIADTDNHFGYIHLPIYAEALSEGKKIKRQAFYKVERKGYAVIFPKEGEWQPAVEAFFGRPNFKNEMSNIIEKHLGSRIKDLVWELTADDGQSDEVKMLTREKEIQALNLKQQELQTENSRIINYALTAGVALVVVLLLILYNRNQIRLKANKQLTLQNKEIEDQKSIIERKNKALTDSIRYANRIQESILPSLPRIRESLSEFFIFYAPRDIVSGDFYWFTELQKNKMILAVGDCTGHGVPGALMTMLGSSLLNHIILEKGFTDPALILAELDEKLHELLMQHGAEKQARDGMDISICAIDFEQNTLETASAKQAVYLRDGEKLHKIKGSRSAVGGDRRDRKIFNKTSLNFSEGDMIYMLSDGFQDQFGGENDRKFRVGPLKEMLEEIASLPIREQKARLEERFKAWKGETGQTDDVLVFGLRLRKA